MSWYNEQGNKEDFVFSTRARIARNIKGFRFPCAMSEDEASRVLSAVTDAMQPIINDYTVYNMGKISNEEAGRLTECRYISPDFANGSAGRAAIVSKDGSVSVMVNEEDHIRIQCFCAGFNPKEVLETAGRIEKLLSEKIDFAFSERYGFLTSCPSNCGTALRLSAMMHLPAVSISGAQSQLLRESARLGMTVRGVYGEGSEAPGNIYQISNQVTLGVSENDIYEKFCRVIDSLISSEDELRKKIAAEASPELKDKIMRCCGILKSAYMISGSEFLRLQSMARLGNYIGITNTDSQKLKKLWIETSPSLLHEPNPRRRDIKRAEIIKNTLL